MTNLSKYSLANGLALATAILWAACSAFVAVFPDLSLTITQWWMHGMTLSPYALTWSSFLLGGLTLVASTWVAGYILGWSLTVVSSRNQPQSTTNQKTCC